MRPDPESFAALRTVHEGVLTTGHLLDLGADRSWMRRQLDAGRWQRLHRGVYYLHSGPVPWRARAIGAVQYAGPGSALSHRAAGHALGFVARAPRVIEVSVPAERRVMPSDGLRIHLRRTMPAATGWLPTVVRPETIVDLVDAAAVVDDAVGLLCAGLADGTDPRRVLAAANGRARLRRRALLLQLLAEVAAGIESPLERRYHHDVERRHGLPRARLQVRDVVGGRWIRADCVYEGRGVRVELDGALAHPGGRTDGDTWRDNAALIERGELTLRYRWRHVAATPCATAAQVARALSIQGWTAHPHPCGPGCTV